MGGGGLAGMINLPGQSMMRHRQVTQLTLVRTSRASASAIATSSATNWVLAQSSPSKKITHGDSHMLRPVFAGVPVPPGVWNEVQRTSEAATGKGGIRHVLPRPLTTYLATEPSPCKPLGRCTAPLTARTRTARRCWPLGIFFQSKVQF